jgi:hypothetical protein
MGNRRGKQQDILGRKCMISAADARSNFVGSSLGLDLICCDLCAVEVYVCKSVTCMMLRDGMMCHRFGTLLSLQRKHEGA